MNYDETVVLPRPDVIWEATGRLHRDKDDASLADYVRDWIDESPSFDAAATRPAITKLFSSEFKVGKDKARLIFQKKFVEVRVNGRDLLKFKEGTKMRNDGEAWCSGYVSLTRSS